MSSHQKMADFEATSSQAKGQSISGQGDDSKSVRSHTTTTTSTSTRCIFYWICKESEEINSHFNIPCAWAHRAEFETCVVCAPALINDHCLSRWSWSGGGTFLWFPLRPIQSSTDAELAATQGALLHLFGLGSWCRDTIATNSQVALGILQGTNWWRGQTTIPSIEQSIQTPMSHGHEVQLWWL